MGKVASKCKTPKGPIAVSVKELQEFGCPYCGYRSGYSSVSGGGAVIWICGECNRQCVGLAKGVKVSPIGIGVGKDKILHPKLQNHPRHGIPSHGRPDERPEDEGEYFHSRGIGLEWNLVCFCCGKKSDICLRNIAAFVQCKKSGKRIVQMFVKSNSDARLDWREHEPDYVQVKVGACDKHLPNLERLYALTSENGVITSAKIAEAIGAS